MKIGEKMFPGSIVALLLGVLLAAPLLYTNLAVEPVAAGPEQLLDIDLTYAYIKENRTNSVVNFFIASNITRLSEDIDPCDAKLLVYLVKFYSDNGFVENLGMFEGLIYNPEINETDTFHSFNIFEIFKTDGFFGGKGLATGGSFGTWNVGESRTGGSAGMWHSSIGEAETMTIEVSLLGWVSFTGNSTNIVVLQEAQLVTEVQMEKYGDGFMYNNIIPEDELADIDPSNPLWNLFNLNGDLE
ncbi:MAG: hypothetical protein PVI43_02540 [Candidatus Bathyarchaeota archaeon]|jgi:hypothetical protein